ncbi:MAG: hypothetical protein WCX71_05325 [Candidatus Buchananbacteria bacterium]
MIIKTLVFVAALIIEILLLMFVLIFLLLGLAGMVLPIIPGFIFIGLALALYLLVSKSPYGVITPRIHPHLQKLKYNFLNLKISRNFMGLLQKLKKKKEEKIKTAILKNGLILLGFNLVLMVAFFLAFVSATLLIDFLSGPVILMGLTPLALIFIFAGCSAVTWYRFGQILAGQLKQNRILNASLVVLISLLPLLVILMLFSFLIDSLGGFADSMVAISFFSFLLMSFLSATFELIIVTLGVITKK